VTATDHAFQRGFLADVVDFRSSISGQVPMSQKDVGKAVRGARRRAVVGHGVLVTPRPEQHRTHLGWHSTLYPTTKTHAGASPLCRLRRDERWACPLVAKPAASCNSLAPCDCLPMNGDRPPVQLDKALDQRPSPMPKPPSLRSNDLFSR